MLINCPECKELISSESFFCVKCGLPFFIQRLQNEVISKEEKANTTKEHEEDIQKHDEKNSYIESLIENKVILTVPEIKDLLSIGINQAYELVKSNQFPVKHIGKKIVVPVSAFVEWLNNSNI